MAVHYYDEDDIEVDKVAGCNVVVNHVVELSEQERSLVRSYQSIPTKGTCQIAEEMRATQES